MEILKMGQDFFETNEEGIKRIVTNNNKQKNEMKEIVYAKSNPFCIIEVNCYSNYYSLKILKN